MQICSDISLEVIQFSKSIAQVKFWPLSFSFSIYFSHIFRPIASKQKYLMVHKKQYVYRNIYKAIFAVPCELFLISNLVPVEANHKQFFWCFAQY